MSMNQAFTCDICGLKKETAGNAMATLFGIKFSDGASRGWVRGQVLESGKHVCFLCAKGIFEMYAKEKEICLPATTEK